VSPNLLLNGRIDFEHICCVCLSGSLDGLDSQFDLIGRTRRGTQTGILRFTMDIFVYKWFPLVTRADEVNASIESLRLWFLIRVHTLYLKTNMRE